MFSVAIYALEAAVAEGERACPGTQARLNPQPRILRRAGLPSFSSPAGAAGGRRPPGGAPPAAPRGGPGWGEAEAAVWGRGAGRGAGLQRAPPHPGAPSAAVVVVGRSRSSAECSPCRPLSPTVVTEYVYFTS